MGEVTKYNPANIRPDNFFAPPTAVVDGDCRYLSGQLGNKLESGGRSLLVGTELEVLFFSPDTDPGALLKQSSFQRATSPNYSEAHKEKLLSIQNWASELGTEYGGNHTPFGTLGIEFRTKPQAVAGYHDEVGRIADGVRRICTTLDVNPVVYSQHIHLSLTGEGGVNVVERLINENEPKFKTASRIKIREVAPLVLLPEEIGSAPTTPVVRNGRRDKTSDPIRAEYRMLSSEYAHDASLNLAVALNAFDFAVSNPSLDPDNYGLLDATSYDNEVLLMLQNANLSSLFGPNTFSRLCNIVAQYPLVSDRTISVRDVNLKPGPIAVKASPMETSPALPKESLMQRAIAFLGIRT